MSINKGNGIKANEKQTSDNMSYVYAENEKKEFVRIQKDVLKMILGIPTKLSELNNDKGFVDKMVNDLENYYLKSETYTRDEIDNKLSLVPRFSVKVVSTLPTEDISETTVYLVPSGEDEYSLYTEYINVDGLWEILGTQKYAFSGNASDVIYDDSDTNLGADNVQGAIGKLSATVNDLKGNQPTASGWTSTQVTLLETLSNYLVYSDKTVGQTIFDNLISSLRGGSSDVTLSSISATYSGGSVLVGTDVNNLTGIVVTAIYSEGTKVTVADYTLSGTIAEGSNTVTISYGGKTTTITVIGYTEEEEITLTSISATYNGGSVTVGTPLTSLTGIKVTGTYSNGSTSEITGYTLSGEIAEGNNTITVNYSGLITTFTVTGVPEADPLYTLESCNNVTVLDRYNNEQYPALLTVDGNDIKWIAGEGGAHEIWYFNVNCSSAITNGVNGRTAQTWFTIPKDAIVELKISNIAKATWNINNRIGLNKTGNTTFFEFAIGGQLTFDNLFLEEQTFTATMTEDTEINALVIDFGNAVTTEQNIHVELYVNGVRWI